MNLESEYAQFTIKDPVERPIFSPKQVLSPTDLLPGKIYTWHMGIVDEVIKHGHRVGAIVDHPIVLSVLEVATDEKEPSVLIETISHHKFWVDRVSLGLAPLPDGKWSGLGWVETLADVGI